jgi:hypothetical protein
MRRRKEGARRNGRNKLVKNILGPDSSDGMPISKERGRRYYVPGLPEDSQHPLPDPRGLV